MGRLQLPFSEIELASMLGLSLQSLVLSLSLRDAALLKILSRCCWWKSLSAVLSRAGLSNGRTGQLPRAPRLDAMTFLCS